MRRTIAAFALVGGLAFLTLPQHLGASRHDFDGDPDEDKFGPWVAAVNLGPVVNSTAADAGPAVSRDGLSLYFQSGRDSATGDLDLYVAHRAAIDLPWEAAVWLGPVINSTAFDLAPSPTADGHHLFFTSLRSGNYDIYVTHRGDVRDDFAWEPPVPLPAPINGASFDAGAWPFERPGDRLQLYFVSDRASGLGQPGLDVYTSVLQRDGTWSTPTSVIEVNSAFQDNRPSIRFDGLEMILSSTRDGNSDLYSSHRNHVWEPWSAPERLGPPINTTDIDSNATLSANGRTLYFFSTRPGGIGGADLYVSTRARLRHGPD